LWAAIVLTGIAGTLLFGVVVLLERQLAWWTDEL
jgi:ABC-type nitrate/sulfonate/bicarbonate transport system permease component